MKAKDWKAAAPARPLSSPEFLDEKIPDEPSYWGPHLLSNGGYTILGGDSGVGKSVLCRTLLIHLAAGSAEFLGLPLPGVPVDCLCISGEGGRKAFRERMQSAALALGFKLRELPIFFLPRELALTGFEDVVPYLGDCRVVLFDPMSKFFLGNENSAPDWRKDFVGPVDGMRARHGIAPLFTDHYTKPNETRTGQHKLRGSAAKIQDAGAVMRLEYGKGGGASRVLLIDRVRDDEKPEPDRIACTVDLPKGIMELDAGGDTETMPDIPDPKGDEKRQRLAERNFAELQQAVSKLSKAGKGPYSERELADAAGMGRSKEGFKTALRGLEASGYLVQVRNGWELA